MRVARLQPEEPGSQNQRDRLRRTMRRSVGLLLGLQIIGWGAYLGVRATNFGGIDEWPVIDLACKGIVSFPYANRMLSLLWVLPACWIAPPSLEGYRLLSGTYISLTGMLTFWLCRRLCPGQSMLPFLAGAFAMLWAPADLMRLSTIQGTVHLGFAFGSILAITLLVESWVRRRQGLMALALVAALATILSYEAVLPLLGMAPLLLPWRRRECRPWVVAWTAVILLGAALTLVPASGHSHEYQAYLGTDLRPAWVGVRLLTQFWLHLAPLFAGFPSPAPTAAIPVLTVLLAVWLSPSDPEEPAVSLRLLATGLIGAAMAYTPYILTSGVMGATRTQILSAPWIAMLLASFIELLTHRLGRAQRFALALAGMWIVFLGASHTSRMQEIWDRVGKFPAQRSSLLQLMAQVPDVKPHTLILLVGETRIAWPMTFGFRHAVAYLYEDRAVGAVAGTDDRPYPLSFDTAGITITPWLEIRKPWRQPVSVYGYDEVIVASISPTGRVDILTDWPGTPVPSLPDTAAYSPFSRIVSGGEGIAARAVLR